MLLDPGKCCDVMPSGKVSEGEEVLCGVCKAECESKTDIPNPVADILRTGIGQLLGQLGAPMEDLKNATVDAYRCPNRNEPWHLQMKDLIINADRAPSKYFRELLIKEANEIFQSRQPTLEKYEEAAHMAKEEEGE